MFFKSGPLAWTGLFCFWIPFAAYFIRLVTITYLLKAIDGKTAEEAERHAVTPEQELEVMRTQLTNVTSELDDVHTRLSRIERPSMS